MRVFNCISVSMIRVKEKFIHSSRTKYEMGWSFEISRARIEGIQELWMVGLESKSPIVSLL